MITANVAGEVARRESLHGEAENIVARRSEAVKEFVGHVFNVPNSRDFEHVENVLHEKITASPRRESRRGASRHTRCCHKEMLAHPTIWVCQHLPGRDELP